VPPCSSTHIHWTPPSAKQQARYFRDDSPVQCWFLFRIPRGQLCHGCSTCSTCGNLSMETTSLSHWDYSASQRRLLNDSFGSIAAKVLAPSLLKWRDGRQQQLRWQQTVPLARFFSHPDKSCRASAFLITLWPWIDGATLRPRIFKM